jgi:aspartate kinase
MKVFKFGGTSVNSVERIKNVGHILKFWANEKIMVIVKRKKPCNYLSR